MAEIIALAAAHDLMQSAEPYTPHSILSIGSQTIESETLTLKLDENGQDFLEVNSTMLGAIPLGIDARTAPRATLTTWLTFPNLGQETTPAPLDIVLRKSERDRQLTTDQTSLTLQSLESLVRDDSAKTTRTFTSTSKLTTSVTQIIQSVIPAAIIQSSIPESTTFLTGDATLDWEPTKQPWAVITEICDSASIGECECFNDGTKFVLRKKPTITTPSYVFTTGANISKLKESTSRDDFYNAVQVTRADDSKTVLEDNRPITGVTAAGRRLKIIDTQITGTAASLSYAQAAINRGINSGLATQIVTPDCPLGLTPGDTVATYIDGVMTSWLISLIEFDLKSGTSTLNLRKD